MTEQEKQELRAKLIQPIVKQFKVSEEEAGKRLDNVLASGIYEHGHPDDPNTQRQTDNLLSLPSEEGAKLVLFEKCISECIHNRDFVRQYDRLKRKSFSTALDMLAKGRPPKNFEKLYDEFAEFVRETVFSRFAHDSK